MNVLKVQQRLNDLGYRISPMFDNYGPQTRAAVTKFQSDRGLVSNGVLDADTMKALFPTEVSDKNPTPVLNDGTLIISKKSVDLIVESEISSESYYNKELKSPIYPGANSGVTIGIGYDLGYNSVSEIRKAWREHVSSNVMNQLISVSGLKGAAAKARIRSMSNVSIPYDAAYKVFVESSLPTYANMALRTYVNLRSLRPDAAGAILSIVYNRGTSLNGSTRREMKNLVDLIKSEDYVGIAKEIRSMKRLWDGVSDDGREKRLAGLIIRREAEAKLVETSNRKYNEEDKITLYL